MTTTAANIRDRIIALIEALTPTSIAGTRFTKYRNEGGANFRGWAVGAGKASAWRRFQVRDDGSYEPPVVSNTDVELHFVTFEIVVAYSQDHRAGGDAALDRDDVMREDQLAIETAIGMRGRANFVSPHPVASWVEARPTERELGDGVDFLVIHQRMMFYCDVS